VIVLLVMVAAPAGGQDASRDCVRERIGTVSGAWETLTPAAVDRRLATMRDRNEWSAIADSLRDVFLAGRSPSSLVELPPAARAALLAHWAELRREVAAGDADQAPRRFGRITDRFPLAFTSGFDDPAGPKYVLFRNSGADSVVVTDSMAEAARRTVCWFAMAASDVVTHFGAPGREALVKAYNARVVRWDNFFANGYSMLPHELLINGLTPRRDLEPPSVQWIVAHPSAGTQMTLDGGRVALDAFERRDVLALEPIGLLWYYRADRSAYVGPSLLVTFPNSGGAGLGVSAHWSAVGRISYVFNAPRRDGSTGGALMLSTDLYRYLSQRRDEMEKLKQLDLARCLREAQKCVSRTSVDRE
jgi:hypothetical protein